MPQPVVVAELVRSGFAEGHHYGSVVALEPDGAVAWSVGAVDEPMFPRSCNKPLQVVGMVRAGLDLPDELLALACSSHSGEPFHIDGVRRILASVGLDEDALQTPKDYPLDDEARDEVIRRGGDRSPVLMNCSGKHAAMLATCVGNGWDIADYRDPHHPLQQAIAGAVAELTGVPVAHVAVDGCGAPLLATTLSGLARAFGRVARGLDGQDRPDDGVARVATAIRNHPAYVSGSRRDERTLIEAIPGAVAKAGAEACYGVGLADGRAFALKCDDGAARARPVLMTRALERSGVLDEPGVDAAELRRVGQHALLGGGKPVGELRATY